MKILYILFKKKPRRTKVAKAVLEIGICYNKDYYFKELGLYNLYYLYLKNLKWSILVFIVVAQHQNMCH
jgi:hypothetical protein